MPNLKPLILTLSRIKINEQNLATATDVAEDLIEIVFADVKLSDRRRRSIVPDSATRLHNNYLNHRQFFKDGPEDAAREAVIEEYNRLLEEHFPNKLMASVLCVNDIVELMKYSKRGYIGKIGTIISISSGPKRVTQPVEVNLPGSAVEPRYRIRLENGDELGDLRSEQLSKLH